MKKSFITEMPDKSGAFLKAGKIIARYGGKSNYREQNEFNRPYYKLSDIISDYQMVNLSKMKSLGEKKDD